MTTLVPKLRRIIPLTPEQEALLLENNIEFSRKWNRGPMFTKSGTEKLFSDNSLDPETWTPKQLRVIADIIESNPTITLSFDGSGSRLDDPADTVIDYDLPNEI